MSRAFQLHAVHLIYTFTGKMKSASFQKYPIFAALKNGSVAEWLGRGLQNLPQQFESARNLIKIVVKGLLV
jgi:hypothetical protein